MKIPGIRSWLTGLLWVGSVCFVMVGESGAQSRADTSVLKGLAAATVLSKTTEGTAALAANYTVTGGIQTGAIRQATLLPFPLQQQQALCDVFITYGNLAQLADGLGTTLGGAYLARAHYIDQTHYTSVSPTVAAVIAYAQAITGTDSAAGKFFFANATTDGKTPASADALAILSGSGGETDIFGKTYGLPAGTPGADAYGNSRPFQTEPTVASIAGPDYLNQPADNRVYNRGPLMNLVNSPSYPSGHTTYGYTGALLLAVLVPTRYQQMVTRGAEYGNDRILVGAHYAMDVLGGRTLALYDMAHLLANDHAYLGRTLPHAAAIADFQTALKKARAELTAALTSACGKTIEECAREDTGRLHDPAGNEAFYADTQTYGLPVVYPQTAGQLEDVGKLAPEAAFLLTIAFPSLTQDEANAILTETEGPGGGFLDDGGGFGVYSRLNLYAAAGRAAQFVSGESSKARRR
jgi:membrane-associated phospholipid phosphatase